MLTAIPLTLHNEVELKKIIIITNQPTNINKQMKQTNKEERQKGKEKEEKQKNIDEDGIRTHAGRPQWISSPSP